MRRAGTFLLAMTLSAGLAACGGAGDGGMEEDTASMQESDAAATGGEEAAAMGATITLNAVNESGITGTAEVGPDGDAVEIEVAFEGLTEGETYPVHLHEGTCSEGGGVAAPIGEVTGGADGTGSASATIAADDLSADASYFVQGHLPDGDPAVCGDAPSVADLLAGGAAGGGA
ncbi:MAG: hypothetical protein ACOC9H_02480 [Gemmatimonadota bacterium]